MQKITEFVKSKNRKKSSGNSMLAVFSGLKRLAYISGSIEAHMLPRSRFT